MNNFIFALCCPFVLFVAFVGPSFGQAANVNRFGASGDNFNTAQWTANKSANLQVIHPGNFSISTQEDADGTLDRLSASSNSQSISSTVPMAARETVTISVVLAGSGIVGVGLAPTLNNNLGDKQYRYQEITLDPVNPQRVTFIDFTKPDDGSPVAVVLSGFDTAETVYAGGARANLVNLARAPNDLTDGTTWVHGPSLSATTPTFSNTSPPPSSSIVSRQDDMDGLLDRLTATAAGQAIYTILTISDNCAAEISLMLSGNGSVTVSLNPLSGSSVGAEYPGFTQAVTLTAIPKRIRFTNSDGSIKQFIKPAGTSVPVLRISAIDTADTVYAGGVKAYPNLFVSPNNLTSTTVWTRSPGLSVTANVGIVSANEDADGKLERLTASSGSQSIQAALSRVDGETGSVSIWLQGSGSVAIALSPIENNPQGIPYVQKIVTLTAIGARVVFEQFYKPIDGKHVAFTVSDINPGETVYAGGARAYNPTVIFDEDFGAATALWKASDGPKPTNCWPGAGYDDSTNQFRRPRWSCLEAQSLSDPPSSNDSIQLVEAPGGRTGKVLKFYVKPTDKPLYLGNSGDNQNPRAEIATPILNGYPHGGYEPSGGVDIEMGRTYYIRTSYYIPSGQPWTSTTGVGETSFDVHPVCDDGHTALEQELYYGTQRVWEDWYDTVPRSKTSAGICNPAYKEFPPSQSWFVKEDSGPLTQAYFDQWVDMEIIWRPSVTNSGVLVVRLNGSEVYRKPNLTQGGNTSTNQTDPSLFNGGFPGFPAGLRSSGYVKEGIYRWGVNAGQDTIFRTIFYGPTLITIEN